MSFRRSTYPATVQSSSTEKSVNAVVSARSMFRISKRMSSYCKGNYCLFKLLLGQLVIPWSFLLTLHNTLSCCMLVSLLWLITFLSMSPHVSLSFILLSLHFLICAINNIIYVRHVMWGCTFYAIKVCKADPITSRRCYSKTFCIVLMEVHLHVIFYAMLLFQFLLLLIDLSF